MAGRRSKKFLEEMAASQSPFVVADEVTAEAPVEAAAAAPVAVDAPYEPAAPVNREAELEAEVARLKAINEALRATSSEKPVAHGWPESVVPRVFEANYKGEFVVNPRGARGVMVLEGTLYVRSPGSPHAARLTPGSYAMLAKAQPHALEAGPTPVRAVFVESHGYSDTLEKYNASVPVAAAPSALGAEDWANAPASMQVAGSEIASRQQPPMPPVPHAVRSKAVAQLMEMRHARGRRGHEVRHPNDRVPVPAAAPAPKAGFDANGAPVAVGDDHPTTFTGDHLVRG